MTPRRSTGQPRRPPRRRNNWQLPSGAGQADCRSPPASARVATPTAKSRRGAAQGRRRGPASTDCAKPFFALAGAGQACRPGSGGGAGGTADRSRSRGAMRGMARWRGRTASSSAGPQWRTTRSLSGGGSGWLIAKFGGGHARRRAPRTVQHTPTPCPPHNAAHAGPGPLIRRRRYHTAPAGLRLPITSDPKAAGVGGGVAETHWHRTHDPGLACTPARARSRRLGALGSGSGAAR